MPQFETENGKVIYYVETGPDDGAPVLLIHGLGGNLDHWEDYVETLGHEGYRVIAPDWPGHNRSRGDYDDYSFDDVVIGIEKLCNKVFGEHAKMAVAGHSAGGAAAQMLYHRNPERIPVLMLLQTGFRFLSNLHHAVLPPLVPAYASIVFNPPVKDVLDAGVELYRGIATFFLGEDHPSLRQQSRGMFDAPANVAEGDFISLLKIDLEDKLPDIDAKVLVVSSRIDPMVPLSHAKKLHAAIPGSELRVVDFVGHNAHLYKADEMKKLLIDFLERNYRQ